ncbi:hypothetical protein L9F63_002492, partial [Diploptera punctata]
ITTISHTLNFSPSNIRLSDVWNVSPDRPVCAGLLIKIKLLKFYIRLSYCLDVSHVLDFVTLFSKNLKLGHDLLLLHVIGKPIANILLHLHS